MPFPDAAARRRKTSPSLIRVSLRLLQHSTSWSYLLVNLDVQFSKLWLLLGCLFSGPVLFCGPPERDPNFRELPMWKHEFRAAPTVGIVLCGGFFFREPYTPCNSNAGGYLFCLKEPETPRRHLRRHRMLETRRSATWRLLRFQVWVLCIGCFFAGVGGGRDFTFDLKKTFTGLECAILRVCLFARGRGSSGSGRSPSLKLKHETFCRNLIATLTGMLNPST